MGRAPDWTKCKDEMRMRETAGHQIDDSMRVSHFNLEKINEIDLKRIRAVLAHPLYTRVDNDWWENAIAWLLENKKRTLSTKARWILCRTEELLKQSVPCTGMPWDESKRRKRDRGFLDDASLLPKKPPPKKTGTDE